MGTKSATSALPSPDKKVRWLPAVMRTSWTVICAAIILFAYFALDRVQAQRVRTRLEPSATTGSNRSDSISLSESRFLHALEALEANNLAEVEREWRELNASGAEPRRAQFLQGAILLRRNEIGPAMEKLSPLVEDKELQARSLVLIGEALYKSGNGKQALGALARAVQIDPTLVDGHRWLGVMYHDWGAMENALQHLKEVGKLAPRDPRPFRLMGQINKDYERYPLAIDDYLECLRRDPLQPGRDEVLVELITSYVRARQYDEALQVVATAPETPEVLALAADCLRNQGHIDQAKDRIRRALEMDRDHLPSLLLAGDIALQEGDAAGAEKQFRHAIEKHPRDDSANYKLGIVLQRQEKEVEAQKYLEAHKVLKAKREKLYELHLDAVQRPNDTDLRFEIASTFAELQFPETAKQWLKAVLSIDPNHGPAKELYERLNAETKNSDSPATQSNTKRETTPQSP